MDRVERLLSTSTRSSRIIEIGPSHSPIAPKRGGWNTFVVDHASQAELRRKYQDHGVNLEAIEEVDGIWQGGPLHDVVPHHLHGRFDTLIASHVIEHLPDLAGFLTSAQMLLAPGGSVVLAVPDRRFCFDYFKPATLTGDVLEAFVTRRSRHAPHTLWNQTAYSVAWDGTTAWGQQPIHSAEFTSTFADAQARFDAMRDDRSNEYVDCHTWHFTPAGFALVILELGQLGVVDWHLETLFGPEGCEFFAILRRGTEPAADMATLQQQRMTLMRQQLQEMREQVDCVLRPEPAPVQAAAAEPAPSETPTLTQIAELLREQQVWLREIHTSASGMPDVRRLADALAGAEQAVAAQHEEVTALRAQLEQRTAELARVTADLELRSSDLRFAQSRMASLNALSEQWRKERELILASRSWRIAAPFRLASRTLRAATAGRRAKGA